MVYKPVTETAAERCVSARQIWNWEQAIAGAFGLTVQLAYDRRRHGWRDQIGRIVSAFGFELTALRSHLPALRAIRDEILAEQERRRALKRRLAAARGLVRKLADAVFAVGDLDQAAAARVIAARIRGRVTEETGLAEIESRIVDAGAARDQLEALLLLGKSCGLDEDISDASEAGFRPIHSTTDLSWDDESSLGSPAVDRSSGRRVPRRSDAGSMRADARAGVISLQDEAGAAFPSVNDDFGPAYIGAEETGAHRIRPKLAEKASSERFRSLIPPRPGPAREKDLVDAARALLVPLGINPDAWREACEIIGPYPAALCVLITERNAGDGYVSSAGGYFRAMARRALAGELNLDRSIFGF